MPEYLNLKDLKIYQLSRELSKTSWKIYSNLDWKIKRIIGEQFIRSVDSVGANIAESYGRFHYLDRVKFLYNSRGSLFEAKHWIELLDQRKLLADVEKDDFLNCYRNLRPGLNGYINSLMKSKRSNP